MNEEAGRTGGGVSGREPVGELRGEEREAGEPRSEESEACERRGEESETGESRSEESEACAQSEAGDLTAAQRGVLEAAEAYAREKLARDSSGHDWWHVHRVVASARRIAAAEGADAFVCELAALLHDVADDKLHADPAAAERELQLWLAASGAGEPAMTHVLEIIGTMSFKGGARPPMRTLEGRVVQDADRLDALGAIGIARTFAYSGWKGRPMHDPQLPPREQMTEAEYRSGNDTAINHFHEKLFKLRDLMNTDTAKQLAAERHHFMELYVQQFAREWKGER